MKQVRLIHQETVDIADSSVYNLEYCIRRLLSVLAYYDLVVKSWRMIMQNNLCFISQIQTHSLLSIFMIEILNARQT